MRKQSTVEPKTIIAADSRVEKRARVARFVKVRKGEKRKCLSRKVSYKPNGSKSTTKRINSAIVKKDPDELNLLFNPDSRERK